MTIIVTFDLATQSGCCYGRPDTTPVAITVRAPVTGEDYGAFGLFYWKFFNSTLEALHARLEPGERLLVVYERPLLPTARLDKKLGKMVGGTQLVTTRKLHSLGVLLETVCSILIEERGWLIDVREEHVAKIKNELAGSGKADKSAMVFVARRAGIDLPPGDEAMDAADAFGLFVLAVRLWAPEHSAAWDRRIHSGPGMGLF